MDSRLIFLPQLVERWRDGNQNARGRVEMSVEATEMEGLENPPSSFKVVDQLA